MRWSTASGPSGSCRACSAHGRRSIPCSPPMASPADAFDRRNLLTYASLLGGVAAVAAASRHHPNVAGVAIALSVVADTFDGRFARRFGADPRRTALAVELARLSDPIAFRIA